MERISGEEGVVAVRLARHTLDHVVRGTGGSTPVLSPVFQEKRGVFVTLTREGRLRGCIGFPEPVMPLGDAIREAATAAALEDPRFSPVRPEECPLIQIEVTVLSVPAILPGPAERRPLGIIIGRHGLIVRGRGRSGLLLPQVATEWGWDGRTFLEHTCQKAGLPQSCWQDDSIQFFLFEGQIFTEKGERP